MSGATSRLHTLSLTALVAAVAPAALAALVALVALGLAGGVATGLLEHHPAAAPWTDPLPAYAVAHGYADYRLQQGGLAIAGAADRVFAQQPPDPAGRLVIDRRHSSKQPEDSHLGLTDYSYATMHGFGRAFDPVRQAGLELDPRRGPMDASSLAGASAVFINLVSGDNPGFRASEVSAIESFVRHGGGLFLITDHSNCYFHGEMLAPLAAALGVGLPPVTATDRGPGRTLSPRSVAWLRVSAIPGHPVTEGVAAFAAVTAGRVEPLGDQVVLARTSGQGWADRWEPYRKPKSAGFTGDLSQQPDEPDQAVEVALAGQHGDGRYVVIADQNAFGAGFIGYEDTARLFANAVAWVSHRDVALDVRGPTSVTTLTGPRQLCTAAADFAFRTLQVQSQRVGQARQTPEFCTWQGDVRSRGLLLLPEAERPDLPQLLDGAERVVALVDVQAAGSRQLLELLGLTWTEGEGAGATLRWASPLAPLLDHPVFATTPAEEAVISTVPVLSGETRTLALDEAGRPVIVAVDHGDADLVLVLDATILSNDRMKGERTDPTTQAPSVQAAHRIALSLLSWLYG